jgi:hypothetical protein
MFDVGDNARVHCSNETHWTRCTEVLRVAVETVVGLTFRVAARVICRLGAARILVETKQSDCAQISPAHSVKDH